MNDLTRLREVSDRVLYGLTADESLKRRILQRAAGNTDAGRKRIFHPIPVFCGVIAVLLAGVISLNSIKPVIPSDSVEMNVFAAGYKETVPPAGNDTDESSPFPESINPDSVVRIELRGVGIIDDPKQCFSLIRLLQDKSHPAKAVETSSSSDLIIVFSDGDRFVFGTDNSSSLCGNGSWICPEFFTAFRQFAVH